ncbi:nitrate reductase molybdenum cofactor assembly chaperone [Parachitinimonas caeni]|uniref:Nitrate reductase molybdenum cofactor assembly chaperone n=1 Tax=Parachitinimonas caeni TaxID=3031301 RepID=A0ABT7E061_9NEIS|nr:nitrate reductase molybdenum cofactor assembly chaperone [Parachitinimonas caeni]MDK2125701.1 nitrate reductase molybdenum cofactor assembly chaperone [Parachitinimonas caeni]
MNTVYQVLSALLTYPGEALIEALPELRAALQDKPELATALGPVLDHLAVHDLISLQETYVATFDRTPSQALHLFEHIHGESRDRGQAMVDLLAEYRQHGFEPSVNELPDFVPLFLEFLSVVEPARASVLLGDAIHVLAAIGQRLTRNDSPYACIFGLLQTLTDVVPQAQAEPPVRDMDEAMEVFGPGADGVEPLLKPQVQPIRIYPRGAAPSAPQ